MSIVNYSFITTLHLTLIYLTSFFIAKILTLDWKFRLKESIYFILVSLLLTSLPHLRIIFIDMGSPVVADFVLAAVLNQVFPFSLFLYFYKLCSYPIKKAFTLTGCLFLYILLMETILNTITPFLILHLGLSLWMIGLHLFLFMLFSIPLAFLATKLLRKPLKAVDENERLQTILVIILASIFIFVFVLWIPTHFEGLPLIASLFSPNMFYIYGSAIVVFISFFFYTKFLRAKFALQHKETEQENLQFYMSEIEQQQTAMRRFKHDYQNILNSLHSFIAEEDWDGLKQYYLSKVEAASTVITQNDFALEALGKIKVREIKGILATKLLLAQNMGIDTSFEADTEIDHIPIDSVTLVRMLGIILDNAIEAAESLDAGQLRAACLKTKAGITFIVQNNCAPDMPSLQQLKQDGFSTKGPGRGQGLSILSELASSCPNVALSMSIVESNFVQKLMIGEL